MEGTGEEVSKTTTSDPERKILGSHHFDSVLDADVVEKDILAIFEKGAHLFFSYNDRGIRRELELVITRTEPSYVSVGKLYNFLAPDTGSEEMKVVTVLIPYIGGKAVISVPW